MVKKKLMKKLNFLIFILLISGCASQNMKLISNDFKNNENLPSLFTCDGNGMGNIAQTDSVVSDFVAYAIQQRNNEGFSCGDVDLDNLEE